jgi:hypothetical protein
VILDQGKEPIMAKPKKSKGGKKVVKDLDATKAAQVAGGRKAGAEQHEYLTVKLNEVYIANV